MKKSNHFAVRTLISFSIILGFLIALTACNDTASKAKTDTSEKKEVIKNNDVLWRVKAIHPDGKNLDIMAIGPDGTLYKVNAIQNSDQDSFLNIKAFVNDKKLPIKILVSEDKYAPIKAIDKGGVAYDIKAITVEGEKLDVKGIVRLGNVVNIKAITKDGEFYGVKAISSSGKLNDIKGIKINNKEKEMTLNGFKVFAHVKAMHQSSIDDDKKYKNDKKTIWNIKAITKDGKNLDVKAIDQDGNKFDIKAVQDSNQYSFMNIKAIVNGNELPVKVLISEEKYAPVTAISRDGIIYEIKAINDDGSTMDIKGVSRSGNIINLKAITSNGEFYAVKALSPDGKLDDVKGIKIFDRPVELTMRGNEVYAHVKAITQ